MGFVLSSTAVIMKMMDDSGDTATDAGQRNVSILLFEDLMIVPLLAIVAVLTSTMGVPAENARPLWQSIGIAALAVGAVFVAGRYVLNPLFGVLAAWLLRHEPLSPWLIFAALCVAGGIALVNLRKNESSW